NGREMSWIRVERYIDRNEFVPMLCQHCDNAPCESVCPVFATYHNPQGLNAQIYKRCVGTRYCSNNCPYMVRRFNWKDNRKRLPLYTVANPDVHVREMGVMEKCTFCVQRIRKADDKAHDENRLILDGEVIPACMEACPYKAIEFGNILDENSNVYKLSKKAERILDELGTEPAVYYIRKNA
ncbi:MAG: 4Fe-4S dicluster domain-containing protein, partial [bacterium]|nr:4Fe-4S dicluster domain-containing protein [bacterium]